MSTDTPDTSRAALEARARYYEEWARDIRGHGGKSVDADYADATAATLRALAARAERAEALNKEAKSVLAVFSYAADLLEVKATESGYIWGNSDYRSWISSYFRPKAFASARALFAHFSAARTELEPDA